MKSTKAIAASSKSSAKTSGKQGSGDAIALLTQDHRNVEALFKEFQTADKKEKKKFVLRICNELIVHTLLEEEIFYKECREKGVESRHLDEAQVEHDGAKV
jgi:hemerythrin superfamily protein